MRRALAYFTYLVAAIVALPGVLALVFEVGVLGAGDGRASLPLGQVWFQHDPFLPVLHTASLPLFGAIVERKLNPGLWDPVIVNVLSWPSWIALVFLAFLFLALAALLAMTGRRIASGAR